ncbi:MAG: hypothetical protein GTO41_05395, partial [Burkholderiales bacterium]|nr:hypothetical protein [Burkholderiales bacterium]
MQGKKEVRAKKLVLAASISVTLGAVAAPAMGADDALVDKLYEKGVLTEQEYTELKGAEDRNKMTGSIGEGGVEWKSKDGQSSIQLHGRVQFDYLSSDLLQSTDGFELRRAYLGVKGKLYGNWTYELTGDFAQMRAEYAYLDYKWSDALQARAGLFKFPYGFSQLTSSRFTDFMERSFTDDFEPGKDAGIAIYGQPEKNVLSYAVGYANGGDGRQNGPDTDKKDIIARGAVNFAPMVDFDKGVLHLGVDWRDGAFDVGGTEFDRTANGLEVVAA